jgi:hypothetical protein
MWVFVPALYIAISYPISFLHIIVNFFPIPISALLCNVLILFIICTLICFHLFSLHFSYAVYYLQVLNLCTTVFLLVLFSIIHLFFVSVYNYSYHLHLIYQCCILYLHSSNPYIFFNPCYCMCGFSACSFICLGIKILYLNVISVLLWVLLSLF